MSEIVLSISFSLIIAPVIFLFWLKFFAKKPTWQDPWRRQR